MTNEAIKQQDVNNAAWAACDTFRGVMDAAGYKDYILVMLFLKYISDVWKDHYEEYRKQYGDDDVRIRRKLERERFILPKGSSYYDLYDQRSESNIGEIINIALDSIETANKGKLEGVFRNIDFNSEANLGQTKDRNRRLKMLLEDFNKPQLDMRPSRISEDVIGNVYIYLIERFASDAGKKAGEFYTPHKVSKLVAQLCKPKVGARICDPACGSGGLLIEAAKAVGDRNYSIYGMEVNGSTWALCRMNMFLHGTDSARIEWCNTLTSPTLVENDRLMKFDNIVANPPFSLDKWGANEAEADTYNRFWRGVPPKSKGDYAFISHMIEAAVEKEGRVSVVVPHGVLFRGAAEGRIREKLIKDNLLDAVIGLPGNLFLSTSIPVAILIFDRSREKGGANEDRKDVLFIDASQDYQPCKNQNALLDEHMEKILNAYEAREEIPKYAHLASYDELKENDFNLNIPRYVDTFEEEAEIDIEVVSQEIDTLEGELLEVRGKMANLLKEVATEGGGDMSKKESKSLTIRNSTAEFLIFTQQAGEEGIEVRYEEESIWLSQKLMSELFSVDVRTISEHLKNIFESGELDADSVIRKFRTTAADGKSYNTQFYNLDAIISVGYRVNSVRATQFRQWATKVLREFAVKGYVMDKKRLENGSFLGEDYFERLLAEIREIRLSERRFYQKITDIYATSMDYNKDAPTTREFFAKVQNKLHYAIHGHTASELVKKRADSSKPHMGLTNWEGGPEGKVVKTDVAVAKNYLTQDELDSLGRIVNAYLELAEDRARRKIPMTMEDWAIRLDKFLEFDERDVLQNAGKISAKIAKDYAESEFEKYRIIQDRLFESDFDKETKAIEKQISSGGDDE